MRLLVDATRRASTHGPDLAHAHREVGKALASSLVQRLPLQELEIEHVAGKSVGVGIRPGSEPIIVALLRSGLFIAEGLWMQIPGSSLVLHRDGDNELAKIPAEGRTVVVVDAVINTGKSLRPILAGLQRSGAAQVMVVAVVANRPGVEALVAEFGDVEFVVARVSERSYVGRGGTDTGARLFGTTAWASDQ
jgi:uracil phosphoribosyltransferase